ncbi:molybdopterin biosynthesis protein MoeB [compost metagenome]
MKVLLKLCKWIRSFVTNDEYLLPVDSCHLIAPRVGRAQSLQRNSHNQARFYSFVAYLLSYILIARIQAQPAMMAVSSQAKENEMSASPQTAVAADTYQAVDAVTAVSELLSKDGVTPQHAWQLFSSGKAVLVDVRTAEERAFVGYVPDSVHVAWATGTSLTRNPRFVRELEAKTGKDKTILLLCRSGKRSALAAEAAQKAGFTQVFNVLEGFEGELNEQQHRGGSDGWRYHQLPWVQD